MTDTKWIPERGDFVRGRNIEGSWTQGYYQGGPERYIVHPTQAVLYRVGVGGVRYSVIVWSDTMSPVSP
jgi:hypothetical protein